MQPFAGRHPARHARKKFWSRAPHPDQLRGPVRRAQHATRPCVDGAFGEFRAQPRRVVATSRIRPRVHRRQRPSCFVHAEQTVPETGCADGDDRARMQRASDPARSQRLCKASKKRLPQRLRRKFHAAVGCDAQRIRLLRGRSGNPLRAGIEQRRPQRRRADVDGQNKRHKWFVRASASHSGRLPNHFSREKSISSARGFFVAECVRCAYSLVRLSLAGAPIAQLDRALVYGTKGCRFNSCWARHFPSRAGWISNTPIAETTRVLRLSEQAFPQFALSLHSVEGRQPDADDARVNSFRSLLERDERTDCVSGKEGPRSQQSGTALSHSLSQTRPLIAGDHPIVRDWLAQAIKREPDFTVSAESATRRVRRAG